MVTNENKTRQTSYAGRILNGEELTCHLCEKGIFEPRNKDYPAQEQSYFQCSHCGNILHILRKTPAEDEFRAWVRSKRNNSAKG